MHHKDKISVLHDMLVVKGRMGLLRPEESSIWVSKIYSRQIDAATSLKKWGDRPFVITALLERSLRHSEGEGVVEAIRRLLYDLIGFDACAFDCSRLYFPYDQVESLGWLLELCSDDTKSKNSIHESLVEVAYLYYDCLKDWEQRGICKLKDWISHQAETLFQKNQAPSDDAQEQAYAIRKMAEPLASCLWLPLVSGSGMPSWRNLVQMGVNPRICALALAMAYMGPSYMKSTVEVARANGANIPVFSSAPIMPPDDAEVYYPITITRDAEAGVELDLILPGAKDWIDLNVPQKEFSPDDPTRFEFVENLVNDNEGMSRIYRGLDATDWNAANIS